MTSVRADRVRSVDQATSLDAVLAASSSGTPDDLLISCELPAQPLIPRTPEVGPLDKSPEESESDYILRQWDSQAPLSTTSETFDTRSARSSSTTSRQTNRLSLTLPIAPPNSMPSRPAPNSSVPPTPVESIGSGLSSPVDPNDLIIAIAAQERRVLEMREELKRAEDDLKGLKNQWNSANVQRLRYTARRSERPRAAAPAPETPASDNSLAARRKLDLDRRKELLLAQSTPRRKVLRGGHARTLSLLSPTKPSHDIPIHEDLGGRHSLDSDPLPVISSSRLSKRATWAPRQPQQPLAVKQMATDFKQGLWTFVEDLRQATVGDEGISATSNRTAEFSPPPKLGRAASDQDTIRASAVNRRRIPFSADMDTPSKPPNDGFASCARQRSASKPELKASKQFSWTPLSCDDLGDDDWSNWDAPSISKPARWSGSTVNGDIIPAAPETVDENDGTLRRVRSRSEVRSSSPQALGELPSALLNSLTPSNIKRFSADFIKDWERSLSPPASQASFHDRVKAKAT